MLTRSHSEYVEGESLIDMIREDLVASVAIDSYKEMIHYFGTKDPTTRRLIEGVLAVEEEHAEDLATLLEHYDQTPYAGSVSLQQMNEDALSGIRNGRTSSLPSGGFVQSKAPLTLAPPPASVIPEADGSASASHLPPARSIFSVIQAVLLSRASCRTLINSPVSQLRHGAKHAKKILKKNGLIW